MVKTLYCENVVETGGEWDENLPKEKAGRLTGLKIKISFWREAELMGSSFMACCTATGVSRPLLLS